MTAVLSSVDPLRSDRRMSLDDNHVSYSPSSTDWRAKYNEVCIFNPLFRLVSASLQVADMLAETRAELDEFHHASKDLEAELENELQRTEKAQQELKVKAIRAESERDEWKSKFMSLQTNHNTTTASLQRELDKLRQDFQQAKIQLRDLEMGNDDLERTERAVSSSLADMEAKYSRALEEKILLEHELLEKASLEEDSQRLRDELRDANVEISILKDQVTSLTNQLSKLPAETPSLQDSQTNVLTPSNEDLLSTHPPPNLELDELSHSSDSLSSETSSIQFTPKGPAAVGGKSTLRRVVLSPTTRIATPPHPRVTRSTTLPSLYTSSPRIATTRPAPKPINASTSTTSTSSTTSKSKGVQMVSEMRARVRNLEQKIHTRVPRLRMGSITARHNPNPLPFVSPTSATTSSLSNKSSAVKAGWDSFTSRRSGESARSNDNGSEKNQKGNGGDSAGWVLIMEDSPSPPKEREKRRMLNSSPSRGSNLSRPPTSATLTSPTLTSPQSNPFAQSVAPTTGARRPHSRLSAGSSTATTNSIPTPTSRPATPTFLPLPSTGLYAHSSTAGITGLKLTAGSGAPIPSNQKKRSSLGASTATAPLDSGQERALPTVPLRSPSATPSSSSRLNEGKALPHIPGIHANVTMRSIQAKPPPSAISTSGLGQSRIGRPAGRKSTDGIAGLKSETPTRARSGSTAMLPR
ncbi:hypothetical protein C0993_001530 [Termitomyces sp. T159_Od127]|nr:hypothetical protein C0993_001530 [Termitomyces sp. T159_Od127]